jgi:D-alanine-D-alanine ligase
MPPKQKLLILSGGWSHEREVSLRSGEAVFKAIDRSRYRPILLPIPKRATPLSVSKLLRNIKPDLVYNALHGAFGEDGGVQKILDDLRIRYTGSGAKASALGIAKHGTNTIAKKENIRIPRSQFIPHTLKKPFLKLPLPVVIKPNASGSSVGVRIITRKQDADPGVKAILHSGADCLVQEYLAGREFSCAVLTGGTKKDIVFPVIEIHTSHRFFDYAAKYSAQDTQEICPAPIPTKLRNTIKYAALRIHQALGCTGLTRSDFIVDAHGTVFFLEINTSPGMTRQSLCPKAAKAYGWNFKRLIAEQLLRVSR